jgi:hypothetical protein
MNVVQLMAMSTEARSRRPKSRGERRICQVRRNPPVKTRRMAQKPSDQMTRWETSSRAPVGAAAAKSSGITPHSR